MNAVAWSAIFLIFLIGMSIAATAIVLYSMTGKSINEASKIACQSKVISYCSQLTAGKNPDWNKMEPKKGCEKWGLGAAPSLEECKKMGFG